jgi:hypothetical protein
MAVSLSSSPWTSLAAAATVVNNIAPTRNSNSNNNTNRHYHQSGRIFNGNLLPLQLRDSFEKMPIWKDSFQVPIPKMDSTFCRGDYRRRITSDTSACEAVSHAQSSEKRMPNRGDIVLERRRSSCSSSSRANHQSPPQLSPIGLAPKNNHHPTSNAGEESELSDEDEAFDDDNSILSGVVNAAFYHHR